MTRHQRGGATPPRPAGFAIRPYGGAVDHPGMTTAITAVRRADGNLDAATVQGMDEHYIHLGDELALDCVIIERGDAIVGYARVTRDDLVDGTATISLFVVLDPSARGLGAEPAIVADRLPRAVAVVRDLAATRATRLGAICQGSHAALRSALEAVGFRVVREGAILVRADLEDIPEVPLPAGYELRPVADGDRAMARRIYDANKRAFADSWGETAPSDEEFADVFSATNFQPRHYQVAYHGDEIAGMVLAYMAEPEADGSLTGMTEGITVQAEHRRRGLARALLASAMRSVKAAGAVRAALSVDLQNPNQAAVLYQAMGFRSVGSEYEMELGRWAAGETPEVPDGTAPRGPGLAR